MIVTLIEKVYSFLWGDLVQIPLPGGSTLGISLLIILLIPTGIYFTVRTRFLPIRLFPDMVQALVEKKQEKNSLSSFQTLIVSTATRVGMGNLVGVVAAISAGGAGAVFWMWVTAIIGSSTAFIEATLAQLYKEKDPLYGVVPQQPPATEIPSGIISCIIAANSSAATSKTVLPSRCTGSPALGFKTIGSEHASISCGSSLRICFGPKPQLNPTASAPSPSTIATALKTSAPVNSLPSSSNVNVTITGRSQFSFAAKSAALIS